MPPIAELRVDGETSPVLLTELEEDLRQGRVPPAAELRFPPWTGDRFLPLAEIPALSDAFDTPNARFADHLLRPARPAGTASLAGVLLLAGLVQLVLPLPAAVLERVPALLEGAMVGFEAVVLRGRWYTPWTAQLVHSGLPHLVSNLVVLAYCGYRVERALGAWGLAIASAAAVLGGTGLIVLLGDKPVVGSSIIAYGLLGALLGVGFRFGDVIPRGQRKLYGYGNLAFFALLLSQSAFAEGISHLGHIGGFVGGYAAAMVGHPPPLWPRGLIGRARRRSALALAVLTGLTAAQGPVARAIPWLSWGPRAEVHVDGATLRIPARMQPERSGGAPYTIGGLDAWKATPKAGSALFFGVDELRGADPAEAARAAWARPGERVVERPAPRPRAPGWSAVSFDVERPGAPTLRLTEHHLVRGRSWTRLGTMLVLDEAGREPLEAKIFARILEDAEVSEPPALLAARDAAMADDSPASRLRLAQALEQSGDLAQADGLYALLLDSELAEEAARSRLQLWASRPRDFDDPADPAWFEGFLIDQPHDQALQEAGLRWLAERGRCGAARLHLDRLEAAQAEALAPLLSGCAGR